MIAIAKTAIIVTLALLHLLLLVYHSSIEFGGEGAGGAPKGNRRILVLCVGKEIKAIHVLTTENFVKVRIHTADQVFHCDLYHRGRPLSVKIII